MKKISNWHLIILSSIILLAAFLRFYKLTSNPPGLYWDEAVFGWDAYSILKTGRDHHGATLPLFFESFGDWKLPVYHYLLVPSIAIFGLNEFAVRFPSALSGVLTVAFFYLLVLKLSGNERLSQLSAFFLAISPWHIQFSRGGFESTVGLFFVVSGVYFSLSAMDDQKTVKVLAAAGLFILSMYSYHAYRIFTPFLVLGLVIFYFEKIKKNLKGLILAILISAVLALPLINFTFSPEGRARAISQSAFSSKNYENERIKFDQNSKKPLRFLSKYWQKPLYFSYQAFDNYIAHFSPVFLFFKGDQIGRHSQGDMGQIYPFELILIIVAFFFLFQANPNLRKIMIIWLILSPIPASIVTPTPHAYRTLQMAIPLAFLSATGASFLINSQLLKVKLIIGGIIVYSILSYWHLLNTHYPQKNAADWQDGYKQMVAQVKKFEDQFDKIYITNINQVPYVYLAFYGKYDPLKFIEESGTRDAFGKYVFVSQDYTELYDKGRILYVAPSWQKVDGKWLAAANDSQGRHIYSLWEVNGQN